MYKFKMLFCLTVASLLQTAEPPSKTAPPEIDFSSRQQPKERKISIRDVPSDVIGLIGEHLPDKDLIRFAQMSKRTYHFFKNIQQKLARIKFKLIAARSIEKDSGGFNLEGENVKHYASQEFTGLKQELKLPHTQRIKLFLNLLTGIRDLKYLLLSNNELTEMPVASLGFLDSIQVLFLHNNQLKDLNPEQFESLTLLRELHLSNNQFEHFPPEIFRSLANLKNLWIDHNNLTKIDPVLFKGLNLEFLDIAGNPLSQESVDALGRALPNTKIIW